MTGINLPWNKGIPRTEQEKRNISEGTRKAMQFISPEKRLAIRENATRVMTRLNKADPTLASRASKLASHSRGWHQTEEAKRRISEANIGNQHNRGREHSDIFKQKISESLKGNQYARGHHHTIEACARISRGVKRWLQREGRNHPAYAHSCSSKNKPNRSELQLLSILDSNFLNQWKFVGDGTLIIDGKCPDFANINGRKELIELYGDYWHSGEDEQTRIKQFAKYVFRCLIIWEHELENEREVIRRLETYTKGN